MKKYGFTLVELLGVIIILGVIALITFPIINKSIKSSKEKALEQVINNIEDAAYEYSISNDIGYDTYYKSLSLDTLTSAGILKDNIINPVTDEQMQGCVLYKWVEEYKQYEFKYDEECNVPQPPPYQDNSGANIPELLDNMVPIKYENDNWVVADVSQEWYDYDAKEWANAVVLNTTKKVGDTVSESEIDLWYVWIPRYKYQLFNAENGSIDPQEIQIKFESGTSSTGTVSCVDDISGTDGTTSSETCTNATNGNWYTHPAFTLGTSELTGFWVEKFEVSTTDSTCNSDPSSTNCNKSSHTLTIKPNVTSLRSTSVSNFFTAIQNINTTYNLNGDSHMMKNMEWGAVAYLSHSKYGMTEEVYINNSSSFYTGRSGGNVGGSTNTVVTQYPSSSTSSNKYYNYGYYTYDGKIVNYDGSIGEYANDRTLGTKASTTGNIYGVYDMSGGAWEYVMGNMVNSSGDFYPSSLGFSETPDSKYYDSYTYGTSSTTHGRGKLGDATKETLKIFGNDLGGWYSDLARFPSSSYSWFNLGGYYYNGSNAGLFNFNNSHGGSDSSRSARAVACVRG